MDDRDVILSLLQDGFYSMEEADLLIQRLQNNQNVNNDKDDTLNKDEYFAADNDFEAPLPSVPAPFSNISQLSTTPSSPAETAATASSMDDKATDVSHRLHRLEKEFADYKKSTEEDIQEIKRALNFILTEAKSRGINFTTGIFFNVDRLPEHLVVDVAYFDKPKAAIDLVQIFKETNEFAEEQFSMKFVKKLYKSMLIHIYGKLNLGFYSPADNPHGGHTPVPRTLFNGIESLLLQGFGIPANKSHQSPAQSKCCLDIKNAIQTTNAYLFSNRRRDESGIKKKEFK